MYNVKNLLEKICRQHIVKNMLFHMVIMVRGGGINLILEGRGGNIKLQISPEGSIIIQYVKKIL